MPKENIAANGDYNLSGERYREGAERASSYPHVRLEEVVKVTSGNSAPQGDEYFAGGEASFIRTSDVGAVHLSDNFVGSADKVNAKALAELRLELFPSGTILFPKSGASTFLNHRVVMATPAYVSSHLACIICEESKALPKFVYQLLRRVDARDITPDQAYPSLRLSEIGAIRIPLPPLEVQKEIVAEIEGYQKVINGARAVLDHYRPHIPIHPDWPMVELGEACMVNPRKSEVADLEASTVVAFVPMSDIGEHEMFFAPKETKRLDEVTTSYTYFKDGDVLLAKVTPCFENGKAGIARDLRNGIGFGSSEFYVLRPTGDLLPQWVFMFAATPAFRAWATPQMTGTGGLQRVPRSVVESFKIPLPPLATQQAIVAEIEAEQALVAANRALITRVEQKIQATLARIWGGEAPAEAVL